MQTTRLLSRSMLETSAQVDDLKHHLLGHLCEVLIESMFQVPEPV